MRHRRPAPPPNRAPAPGPTDSTLPSRIELDRFSAGSLHKWSAAAKKLDALHRALYFELESPAPANSQRLQDAIRAAASGAYAFSGWSRIVDYRYSLEPLSVAGSLKRVTADGSISAGNWGPVSSAPFPAPVRGRKLSPLPCWNVLVQIATSSKPRSFHCARLRHSLRCACRGGVETVLDVSNLEALKTSGGGHPRLCDTEVGTEGGERDTGLRQSPWLIRSPITLQRQLLLRAWRMVPTQFELPANSQMLRPHGVGDCAGIHGILYPSVRNSPQKCLALFPQNWARSSSVVEVMDAVPDAARLTRIDGFMQELT